MITQEVPAVAQWVKNLTARPQVFMEAQVWSLAWASGLKDMALRQMWYRCTCTQIQSLAQELPYAMGVAIKKKKKYDNSKGKQTKKNWRTQKFFELGVEDQY